MNDVAIKVEGLSKQYRLGNVGTGTLGDDLKRWWARINGKEDPFLKIGDTNDRASKADSDYVWSLKDISFEVGKGEVVGVIGKNGAGKSTLLKILSRVTGPTEGRVMANGRIGSLLEVGTGFHPELTGRENIFLNGAILGMTKEEVKSKLDNIINFSGCARYIDTPTKRYSSGMKVRLAFAVAAFLEPEILIVDEVLAVGDAEFQKKAIGKMKDVSKGEGRTVLFVSHNMNTILNLCTRTILLEDGNVVFDGDTQTVISKYLERNGLTNSRKWEKEERPGDESIKLNSVNLVDFDLNILSKPFIHEPFGIEIEFEVLKNGLDPIPNIHFKLQTGEYVFITSDDTSDHVNRDKGTYKSVVWVPGDLLNECQITVLIALTTLKGGQKVRVKVEDALQFSLFEDSSRMSGGRRKKLPGIIKPKLVWETSKV